MALVVWYIVPQAAQDAIDDCKARQPSTDGLLPAPAGSLALGSWKVRIGQHGGIVELAGGSKNLSLASPTNPLGLLTYQASALLRPVELHPITAHIADSAIRHPFCISMSSA